MLYLVFNLRVTNVTEMFVTVLCQTQHLSSLFSSYTGEKVYGGGGGGGGGGIEVNDGHSS